MRLEGKVALVTGGSRGIGRAIALLFAEEGATVVAGDVIDPEGYGDARISWERLDVSKAEDWSAVAAAIVGRHGKLDVLVNNAGLVGSYDPIDTIDLDVWRRVLDVNMGGAFLGMRTAIPLMRRSGGGAIVNISSIWGLIGAEGVAAYQASKGAIRSMTKNAALSYARDGIRVNSVHPGLIDTHMVRSQDRALTDALAAETPLQRVADPREVAYGVLYLASDEASYVTGAELVIDGGYTIR